MTMLTRPVQDLVQGLLAPAQAEVGRRWEANQWSVADEHAAHRDH